MNNLLVTKESEHLEQSKKKLQDEIASLSVEQIITLKNAILSLKQGEALERITRPPSEIESFGLNNYSGSTNVALSTILLLEAVINDISGLTDDTLKKFAIDIANGSGSKAARKVLASLETIGRLGQAFPNVPEMNAKYGVYGDGDGTKTLNPDTIKKNKKQLKEEAKNQPYRVDD